MGKRERPEADKPTDDMVEERNLDMAERLVERAAKKGRHSSEKENMASALKLSYIFIGILVVINIFMAFGLLNVYKDRSVSLKIPPATLHDTELVFGSDHVNKAVYEVYTDYLIRDIANVNFRDVDEKFQNFIQYTDKRKYMKIAKALADRASEIKRNLVSQNFVLQRIELTQLKNGFVKAVGVGMAERYVGDTKAFEDLPYQITLYLTTYYGNVIVAGMKSGVYNDPNDIASRRKVKQYEERNPYLNF